MIEKLSNYHTVRLGRKTFVKLLYKILRVLCWNFVKATHLLKILIIQLIWRKNFFHSCTVCSLRNFCITWKLFREINFTVKLFTTEVVSTEIFQKTVIQKFCKLHTTVSCTVWINEKTLTEKLFRKTNCLVFSLVKTLLSQNFCEKRCESKLS